MDARGFHVLRNPTLFFHKRPHLSCQCAGTSLSGVMSGASLRGKGEALEEAAEPWEEELIGVSVVIKGNPRVLALCRG